MARPEAVVQQCPRLDHLPGIVAAIGEPDEWKQMNGQPKYSQREVTAPRRGEVEGHFVGSSSGAERRDNGISGTEYEPTWPTKQWNHRIRVRTLGRKVYYPPDFPCFSDWRGILATPRRREAVPRAQRTTHCRIRR